MPLRLSRPSSVLAIAAPLIGAAAIGIAAAARFPVFDDEANAITNASQPLTRIVLMGLGQHGQFHPPLWEVVLHGWLAVAPGTALVLVRLPSVALWIGALIALAWALRPVAEAPARRWAVAVAAAWPAHLILPFAATWYALGALLAVVAFGALLRGLIAESPSAARRAFVGATLATVTLGYTVFAWPFVMVAVLIGASVATGGARLRARWRSLLLAGAAAIVALAPTASALRGRLGPMLARRAGGDPLQSIASITALLVGHSAPALFWVAVPATLAAAAGVALAAKRGDRVVRGTMLAGALTLMALAATSTLNDKRVLLGSLFVAAGLGLAVAGTSAGRSVLALSVLAALPAWLGWFGIVHAPFLFPRWQDPVNEIARRHAAGAPPRLLISDQPAIVYAAVHLEGEPPGWQTPLDEPTRRASLHWRAAPAEVIAEAVSKRDRSGDGALRTIDVVVSAQIARRAEAIAAALQRTGWRVTGDQKVGTDLLARWRHGVTEPARVRWISLERAPSAAP